MPESEIKYRHMKQMKNLNNVIPESVSEDQHGFQEIPSLTGLQADNSSGETIHFSGYDRHAIPVIYEKRSAPQGNAIEPQTLSLLLHELLGPLTLIKGYVSALLQIPEKITEEHKTGYLHRIEVNTNNIITLIDALREVSKYGSNRSNMFVESTPLTLVLQNAVSDIRMISKEHIIRIEESENLPLVDIDQMKITQVITNLLSNAVKYSPEGSEIAVYARRFDTKEELQETYGKDLKAGCPCVVVSIRDNGTGIREEEKERIFEPFYRSRYMKHRGTPGIGLGLYITRTIIEAHGGHVWVNSVLRRGSTFSFSIPLVHTRNSV